MAIVVFENDQSLSVDTSYSGNVVELQSTQTTPTKLLLSGLWLYVTTIASSPTTLTVKLSRDSGGDELILPEWELDLITGQTTATDGTAIGFLSDIALGQNLSSVYLWIKTDAGTCTLTEALLTGIA